MKSNRCNDGVAKAIKFLPKVEIKNSLLLKLL